MSLLAHNVYFALKTPSPAGREALVNACRTYLKNHPGIVFFAAGVLEPELSRPVNDRDFDVALHVIFQSRADHDRYQDAPAHLQFVAENKDTWGKVRVFDSLVD